jgi:GTP cyclohydrolase III
MGAEQPAAAAEACNQLQSAGSAQKAERQWAEHYTAGLLDSFRVEEVEDRCCIADIAGEGVVRIYFQISIIPFL